MIFQSRVCLRGRTFLSDTSDEDSSFDPFPLNSNNNLFEGVWFANYPSSLPLRAVFPGSSRGFGIGDSRLSRRSNATFFIWRVPPRRSHLERFCAKSMLSLRWGTHVCSRPLVFSTGSALGALESKSLQVYSRFCVHFSKTTVKAE